MQPPPNIWDVITCNKEYSKKCNLSSPVPRNLPLYDDIILRGATNAEVHLQEVTHNIKCKNCALYNATNDGCVAFLQFVVDDTWLRELKITTTYYTLVTFV